MINAVENIGYIFSLDDLASGVVLKLQKNVEGVTKGVGVSVEGMVGKAEKGFKDFGETTEKAGRSFRSGFATIQDSIIKAMPAFELTNKLAEGLRTSAFEVRKLALGKEGMEALIRASEQLGIPMERLDEILGQLRTGLVRLHPPMGEVMAVSRKLGMSFAEFETFVTTPQTVEKYSEAVKKFGGSFAELNDYLEMVNEGFKSGEYATVSYDHLLDGVKDGLIQVGDEANTTNTKMSFLRGTIGGMAKGAAKGIGTGAAMALGFGGVEELLGFLKNTFAPFLNVIKGTVDATFAPMKKAFYDLATKIAPILSAVLTPLVGIVKTIVDKFTEVIGSTTIFSDLATTIFTVMKALQPVIDTIFGMMSDRMKMVVDILPTLADLFNTIVQAAAPLMEIIGKGMKDFAVQMAPILVEVLKMLAEAFTSIVAESGPMLKEMIGVVFELMAALMPLTIPLIKLLALLTKFTLVLSMKEMMFIMKPWIFLAKVIAGIIKPIAEFLGYLVAVVNSGLEPYLNWMVNVFDEMAKILTKVGLVLWDVFVFTLKVTLFPFIVAVKMLIVSLKFLWDVTVILAKAWYAVYAILFKVIWFCLQPLILYGKVLIAVYSILWDTLVEVVSYLWNASGAALGFSRVIQVIVKAAQGLYSIFSDFFSMMVKGWDHVVWGIKNVKTIFEWVVGWFREAMASIGSALGFDKVQSKIVGVLNALKAVFTVPIQVIKNFINDSVVKIINAVLGIKIPVIGRIGNIVKKMGGPDYIPQLAEGGIVTSPTVATIGEVPEVITPLTKEGVSKFLGGLLPAITPKEPAPLKLDKDTLGMLRKVLALLEQIVDQGNKEDEGEAPALEGM